MKKVISLLLASAMIAGLTACGGSGSSSASSEPAAETAEGGEATEGTEAAASGERPSTAPIPMRMTTRWQQPSHPTICPTSCS